MANTKQHPETGETLYARRRTGGGPITESMYVWESRNRRVTLDATPEEDAEIHASYDTDRTITGRR